MQRIFSFRKSEDGEQEEKQQKTLQTIEKWLAAEKGSRAKSSHGRRKSDEMSKL